MIKLFLWNRGGTHCLLSPSNYYIKLGPHSLGPCVLPGPWAEILSTNGCIVTWITLHKTVEEKVQKEQEKWSVSVTRIYVTERRSLFYNLQRRTHRRYPPLLLFLLSHPAPSSMDVKTITVFLIRLSQFITAFRLFPFSMAIILDQDVGVLQ